MVTLTQVGSVPIARGPVVLSTPHISTDAVFTGDADRVVVKVAKKTLKEEWRKKTKLQVRGGHGEVVLLAYFDEMQAWSGQGDVLWKRKTTQNFMRRNEKLYFLEPRLEVVDVPNGRVLEAMDCPQGAPELLLGSLLLLTDALNTDPVRVFDLGRQRVLWERPLAGEMRERYGVDEHGAALAFAEGEDGRCVVARGNDLFGVSMASGELLWRTALRVPYFGVQVGHGRIPVWTTASSPLGTKVTVDLSSGQITRERPDPSPSDNRFVLRHFPLHSQDDACLLRVQEASHPWPRQRPRDRCGGSSAA